MIGSDFSGTSWIVILGIFFLLALIMLTYYYGKKLDNQSLDLPRKFKAEFTKVRMFWFLLYFPLMIWVFFAVWFIIIFYGWESHLMLWLNLLVRWAHVIIGIGWIGTSFYFIFLENSLNRTKGLRDELAGNLWAIHGGGFYYVEKYKIAPQKLPEKLHWFKYEAYFTWITGFLLLIIVYYSNIDIYLPSPGGINISPKLAIGVGIGSLPIAWIIYDFLCKSPISQKKYLFNFTAIALICALAFCFTHVFSGKAAYIHVGAILGTLMVGNVFMVIIPSQKAMVKAAQTHSCLDLKLGKNAGYRSLHNNYMTLPVVFIMLSNHFPTTFGHQYNWAILAGLVFTSSLLRHYFNLTNQGLKADWIIPCVSIGIILLVFVSAPLPTNKSAVTSPIYFEEVQGIFKRRCLRCHSSTPTDENRKSAPKGVMFDTPQQITNLSAKIMERAVVTQTMPLGNKTGMTKREREKIRQWILQGAKIMERAVIIKTMPTGNKTGMTKREREKIRQWILQGAKK